MIQVGSRKYRLENDYVLNIILFKINQVFRWIIFAIKYLIFNIKQGLYIKLFIGDANRSFKNS